MQHLPATYSLILLEIRAPFIAILPALFICGNKALRCVCILHIALYSGSDILFYSSSPFRSINLSQSVRVFLPLFADELPSNVGFIEHQFSCFKTNYQFKFYLHFVIFKKIIRLIILFNYQQKSNCCHTKFVLRLVH